MNKKFFNLRNTAMIVACLAAVFIFSGCKKTDPLSLLEGLGTDKGDYSFGVKQGTVHYNADGYSERDRGTMTLIFDDYGKKLRIERNINGSSATIIIWDQTDVNAVKGYTLDPESKTYLDKVGGGFPIYDFLYVDDNNKWYEGGDNFKKLSDRNIAGKSCNVCSFTDSGGNFERAGWNHILFYKKDWDPKSDYFEQLTATDFSETIPANSFTVPNDYTK